MEWIRSHFLLVMSGWRLPLPILILSSALLFSVVCALPKEQRDTLVALYDSTSGPRWTNTWDLTTDPCWWWGVTCDDSQQQVTNICLPGNNLIGTLPDLQLPGLLQL
jgi:hypothetical protein